MGASRRNADFPIDAGYEKGPESVAESTKQTNIALDMQPDDEIAGHAHCDKKMSR